MKDRILNILLVITVGAALTLTLLRGDAPDPASAASPGELLASLPTPHPAAAFRTQREQTRAREKEALLALMENDAQPEDLRALARTEWEEVTQADEIELAMEAALAARGYGDALCVCRRGTLTIFTGAPLTDADAALLFDLAAACAGIDKASVHISGY